ncbi:MAG: AAA family ATPase [Verrucomicrobium sp.]
MPAVATVYLRSCSNVRLLISGGPGSGCTSTAKALGERLGWPVFDSDSYFHKSTEPPFQEQYSPEERRSMLSSALEAESNWILSGSVATWGLHPFPPTHGIFLNVPRALRLERLLNRQRKKFGRRIDAGGDMQEEHASFIEWAAGYEERTGSGRNLVTDRAFLETQCRHLLVLTEDKSLEEVLVAIVSFMGALRTRREFLRSKPDPAV